MSEVMEYGERDHYIMLAERFRHDADSYKAKLFDAWQALRQQQKGMRHQARKIKRLHAELAAAKNTIKMLKGA